MAEDMKDWKPMEEDFQSLTFNSYRSDQTAALLPFRSLPSITESSKKEQNIMLYIEGFPSDLTEEGLKTFLRRIGCQLLRVQIILRQDFMRNSRPFGFIHFESTKAAQKGIQLIKNQKLFKLFVCFTSTQTQIKLKEGIKEKEFQEFSKEFFKENNEMKDQIVIDLPQNKNSNQMSGHSDKDQEIITIE